jgi:DDE superfamily endonuclease
LAKLDAADVNLCRTGLRAQLLDILVVDTYVPARMTHDYLRHGTTSLFAALEVASGKVHGRCYRRHRHAEFIVFLESLAKRYPKLELHLICDDYGTHKHPAVKQWLAAHPRFHLHFTPTSASWLNLVKRWFGLITAQAIRRGSFDSVARLEQAITRFLANWNENAKPFRWTKSAHQIKRSIRNAALIYGT